MSMSVLIRGKRRERSTASYKSIWMFLFAMLLALLVWIFLSRGFDIVTIDRAEGTTRVHEGISGAYSNGIAELMAQHDYFYQQASTILELYAKSCSQAGRGSQVIASAVRARNEALCSVFTEAAKMVGTYPRRLDEGDARPQALFRFDLFEGGEERAIGPFLSRRECTVIAARLMQFGEQVTSCLPYEKWHYALFFAGGGD